MLRGYLEDTVESWLRAKVEDEPLLVLFGFVEVKLILTLWD